MSKLILMQGLPASGKSTRAEQIMKESGNAVRLNRDLLRTMLHFDKWSGKNEGMTKDAERILAKEFLLENKVVIIDDTNLNPGTIESWKQLAKEFGASFEIQKVHTDFYECIGLDMFRPNSVGVDVIAQMARRYNLYPWNKAEVIVDIDGTLSDLTHRLHFSKEPTKDWDKFFELVKDDSPRQEIIDQVKELSHTYNIILVSGRPERCRQATLDWMNRHGVPVRLLFMRQDHDKRPDTEVKQDILNKYFRKDLIKLVIDDRPSVIRMWRENGLEVMDVGTGEEFKYEKDTNDR